MLFDRLVTGHVIETNPFRGPRYTINKGKTPGLTAEESPRPAREHPHYQKKQPMIQRQPISLISSGCATAPSLASWSAASPGSAPSFR
jgi:hypothetical protein